MKRIRIVASQCSIQPGCQALSSSLFISSRAIDLAGEKQASQPFDLQRWRQLSRIDMIIFDRIARLQYSCLFETRDRFNEFGLYIRRQRGGNPVRIDRVIVQSLRLEKDLMSIPLSKFHQLVFDRRAITRPDALDLPGIHCRAHNVVDNDAVGRFGRPGHPAFDLWRGNRVCHKGEGDKLLVSSLSTDGLPVDRLSVQPGGCAGLQTSQPQSKAGEGCRQSDRRRFTHTPGRCLFRPDMNKAAQKGARGQNHRRRFQGSTILHDHAGDATIDNVQIKRIAFDDIQVRRRFDRRQHCHPIKLSIGLRPRSSDSRALLLVEHPELNACNIGDATHQAIHRIDLPNQMALAQPANRRITGHDSDRLPPMRNQSGFCPEARSCAGSLRPRMAATDHNHIEDTIRHSRLHIRQAFHVKPCRPLAPKVSRESFANTKFGEDYPEQMFDIHPSGNSAQILSRNSQLLGSQFKIYIRLRYGRLERC
ncbi:hypothetical protein CUJ84_Chr004755 [Rhizobium leguminosarum]|uniref:Uncharacterized protein n=1 Tax=Rhizobium leguminosarum TaxID=384 RepID=A0A2K9Z9W9_RHILE|nr:hypothetical protein CUJ84_Chr004755 [Rhizobium leguminosarum]